MPRCACPGLGLLKVHDLAGVQTNEAKAVRDADSSAGVAADPLIMISTTGPHRSVGPAGSLAVLRRGRCQRSRRGFVGQMSAIMIASYQIVT